MDDFLSEIEYNRLDELLDTVCGSLSEDDQQFLRQRIPLRHACETHPSSSSAAAADSSAASDGRDLAAVLRRSGVCDETQLGPLLGGLKCLRRYDLLRIAYSHERKAVKTDPLEDFLMQEASKAKHSGAISGLSSKNSVSNSSSCGSGKRLAAAATQEPSHLEENHEANQQRKKRRTRNSRNNSSSTTTNNTNNNNNNNSSHSADASSDSYYSQSASTSSSSSLDPTCTRTSPSPTSQNDVGVRQRQTCDVRLRVWAEYCDHERVLRESVFSQKADAHERQLERFSQASAVLRSRDLGYIVCDIKFSEITYLDAFWRDYLNGSLLEALKGVFITESLKQAVGNEPIKLLVSIDEEDYEEGRQILMNNVYLDHGRE